MVNQLKGLANSLSKHQLNQFYAVLKTELINNWVILLFNWLSRPYLTCRQRHTQEIPLVFHHLLLQWCGRSVPVAQSHWLIIEDAMTFGHFIYFYSGPTYPYHWTSHQFSSGRIPMGGWVFVCVFVFLYL